MAIIQWILAIPLFLLFIILTLAGYLYILRWLITRKPQGSPIHFVGGISGMLAVIVAPIESLKPYWWLPLFLDLFTLPNLLFMLILWIFLTVDINRKRSQEREIIVLVHPPDEFKTKPKKHKKKK